MAGRYGWGLAAMQWDGQKQAEAPPDAHPLAPSPRPWPYRANADMSSPAQCASDSAVLTARHEPPHHEVKVDGANLPNKPAGGCLGRGYLQAAQVLGPRRVDLGVERVRDVRPARKLGHVVVRLQPRV
eukprot:scaffold1854_cov113-Isochrysis_galbana.AAC.9